MTDVRRGPASARLLLGLFFISGFAGIIYESVWSHYLRLFLGHAAYAQAIVLVLFMGGMALGAWLVTGLHGTVDRLRTYVAVEASIGLLALVFHHEYLAVTGLLLDRVLPLLPSPALVEAVKVLAAAALVGPQAVLLGATFPLMTVAALRRLGQPAGRTVASLYFVNSCGAAIGVLASGFVIIGWVGLDGAVRVAGVLNLALAATLWWLCRRSGPEPPAQLPSRPVAATALPWLLLAVAAFTGFASFVYEIAWIRMLSMVLGTSSHAFELMLSAFIFGLAGGGWWIRRRIDSLENPREILGYIQVAMAVLAIATIPFYDFCFDLMAAALVSLGRTQYGYGLFLLFSHGIALLVMLPATLCAGMTLPLITHVALREGHGEGSVGRVYAANTAGAILGVTLALGLLVPVFGLQRALVCGALVDLVLGAVLLARYSSAVNRSAAAAAVGMALIYGAGIANLVPFDPRRAASAVYRSGVALLPPDTAVDFRRDGRSATVTVITTPDGIRSLATNGKADASIQLDPARAPSVDEATQVLSGAVPLMFRPAAARAAVIGIGSGMTSEVLLQSPAIERLDTIEIEAAMVAGARLYRPLVDAVFTDPRSRIVINDARTAFATAQARYDLIVSEPSNPWVSGVSSLFTLEFYRLVKRYLAADGVLAQWMQLYEIDLELVASVFKALASEFEDFRVVELGDGNVMIVAARGGPLDLDANAVYALPGVAARLARVGIHSAADLESRYLGGAAYLMPLFETFAIRPNSDFRPVLDLGAARSRFLGQSAAGLAALNGAAVPLRELLGGPSYAVPGVVGGGPIEHRTLRARTDAAAVSAALLAPEAAAFRDLSARDAATVAALASGCAGGGEGPWAQVVSEFMFETLPLVPTPTAVALVDRLFDGPCAQLERAGTWRHLFAAIARRDGPTMGAAAAELLDGTVPAALARSLVAPALLGLHLAGDEVRLQRFFDDHQVLIADVVETSIPLRLILAHAGLPISGAAAP